jgi:histidinol-phosphate aminotransferase
VGPLYEIVVDILVAQFNADRDQMRPGTSFQELDFDSLSRIDLSVALSEKLRVKIDDDEIFKKSTVGDVVEMLEDLGAKT